MFPLATYPAVIAVVIGVLVALTAFAGVKLPERVLSYSWPQIYAAAALFALVIMLGWLILDKGGSSLKYGAVLMLIGTVGLVLGTTMELLGKGANVLTRPATPPPASGAAPPPRHRRSPPGRPCRRPHRHRHRRRLQREARNASIVAGYRRRSTALMRSWRLASSSPGSTSTASWARIGPWSTCSVATCTVQPVTFTP